MRRNSEPILSFAAGDEGLPKTGREFRQKYKGISDLLDEHPEILDLVHRDLLKYRKEAERAAKPISRPRP